MKRSVKILLAILMVSLLVLALSACQDPCADGHLYTPGEITKQPTCTSEGERTYTCSRCGQTFTQSIGKLPHSLQTLEGKPATCADAGLTSSFKCSVCGEIIPPQEAIPMLPAHTWDNGTVTTEPKCKDGEITFKCTVCGATRTEVLTARHNYDNGVLTVAPTCGDYGQRVYTCKDCGATYQVLVAPMADQHVFGPWVEETDEHVGYFQCQNCGKYFDKDGNLLPSINKGEQLPVWKLVTSDSTPIALGDRIVIVAKDADMAMCTTQKTNNRDGVAITRDAATQTIVITSEVQIITVEAGTKNGTFALAVGTGQYLRGAGTSKSTLTTAKQVDDESSWTIEVSADGIATVKSQGTNARNWLRYNSTGSNHLFNCYESGQDDIQIYRYTGSGEIVFPGEHECQHQCPTCGKCTSDCEDPACADKCLGHEVASDAFTPLEKPRTGEYYLGMYSTDKSAWYYFTGVMGGFSNYYYATSTEKDSAALVVVEASGSGYHFKVKSSGNYLNLGPRGTDYTSSSLSIGATATTVWTWDATKGVFYTELSNSGTTTRFYLGNYSANTDLSGMKYFNDGNYAAVLGTFGQPEPECQHTNRTEHPLKEATCTEDGNIQYWSCNNCGKLFNAATGGDIIEQSTTVLKAGHKYSAQEVAQVPAKCEKDGVKAHYTCTVCNKKFVKQGELYVEQSDEQLKISQLGHDFEGQDWVQSDDGKHYKQCVRFETCGGKDGEEQCNTAAWKQTDTTHQKKCSVCGRLSGDPESHTYDQDGNKCVCGYSQHAAQVGEEYFTDLASALNKALTLSGEQTITLLANNTGAGLRFTEHTGKITIDLGKFTYTVNAAVGSAGTESQALQVLPGAEVEIKGGTIAAETGKGVVRLVNNYGNLTLNGVTLDATNVSGCDAAVVAYNGELALTNVTFKDVPATAYALSATYWSKYPDGVQVTVDELTDFATGNKGVEIDLDTLKGETSPTGAKVTVTFAKEQRTKGADNYTIKVLGPTCDDLTAVTFNGTKISHNYLKEDDSTHVCSICGDSGEHVWVYDATGTKNDTQHTVKCEGCGEIKLVDHTYNQEGNKCVCGQVKEVTYKDVYTLTQTKSTSNSDYTRTYSQAEGGITWAVNANMNGNLWQFGGGKKENLQETDRTLTSKTAFAQNVDRIQVTLGVIKISGDKQLTVNSVKIEVFDSDPTSGSPKAKHSQSFDWQDNGVLVVDRPQDQNWSNCYYKITINITTTGTTGSGSDYKNSYCTLAGLVLQTAE